MTNALFRMTAVALVGSVLFANSLWASDSSKKATCESSLTTTDAPKFFDLYDSTNTGSERFVSLISKGLSQRYENDQEVQDLIQVLHTTHASMTRTQINVEWSIGKARLSKKLDLGRIIYIVESINVFEEGVELAHGAKPHKPSQILPKLLSAITEAMRLDILENPEIRRSEIVMSVVVNQGLLALLKDLGFQKLPANYAAGSGVVPMNPMGMRPSFGMQSTPMLQMDMGSGFTQTSPPQGEVAPSLVMGFVNRALGRGR